MRLEDQDDGEYRIHAGSLALRAGQGRVAALITNRSCDGKPDVREACRDIELTAEEVHCARRAINLGCMRTTQVAEHV